MANLLERARTAFLSYLSQPGATHPAGVESSLAVRGSNSLSMMQAAAYLSAQTAGSDFLSYAHPIRQITERSYGSGLEHDVQLLIYHLMRQYVPTMDAAIKNRRTLEGDAHVVSEDKGLADLLNDWMAQVPVGYIGGRASLLGLNVYANMMADNADEYGMSAGEILADKRGREVTRLVVPNVRTLILKDDDKDGFHELYQQQKNGSPKRIDDNPLVQVLTFTYSNESPWPFPMAWSLVKSTEAVLRMYESVINGWWRFGDPSLMLGIEYTDKEQHPEMQGFPMPDGSTVDIPKALLMMKQALEGVMKARRSGKVGDAYVFTDAGGTIKNEVLGDIDQSLMRYFKEQSSVFESHIVAHSDTPVWMYPSIEQKGDGLGSAKSNNQALIASVAAHKRNVRKGSIMQGVLDTMLLLTGDARYIGRYELEFDSANILDDKYAADTRKVEAEADTIIIGNSFELFNQGTTAEEGEDEQQPRDMRMNDEQIKYLQERGVLPAK